MEIVVKNPSQGSGSEVSGECPHCGRDVTFVRVPNIPDLFIPPIHWLGHRSCPNPQCNKHVFFVAEKGVLIEVYPKKPTQQGRPELPSSVPEDYRKEYREAGLVLDVSPKSSEALSRRCLQRLLREHLGIKKKDLAQEIDELLNNGGLPAYLAETVDAIRNVGNFAAHPLKYTNTGEIVEVEPGEAEWTLDVLEMLFDFYFVQPDTAQSRKAALNQKLQQLGKPPMK
jgi:hypothetical protein